MKRLLIMLFIAVLVIGNVFAQERENRPERGNRSGRTEIQERQNRQRVHADAERTARSERLNARPENSRRLENSANSERQLRQERRVEPSNHGFRKQHFNHRNAPIIIQLRCNCSNR